ncbi:MAG: efflux RND transporter periplasmic adaptor subunit [Mariprofundaceae bacterium]|nr:efflux RND transporter periplasmic adaptor subunit [Mariprofundaceae bacterium]
MTESTDHDVIRLQQHLRRWRNATLAIIAAVITAVSWQPAYTWWQSMSSTAQAEASIPPERIHTVANQLLKDNIKLSGKIRPLASVEISSPFSGTVSSVHVRYGDTVKQGQLLFSIQPDASFNSGLMQTQLLYNMAWDKMKSLKSWSSSSTVRKARRAIIQQQQALKKAKRKRDEDRLLYQQGVIAKSQLEASEQALKDAKTGLSEQQEALRDTLAQGSKHEISLQQLKLEVAHNNLISLQNKLALADVYATIDGILMLPEGKNPNGSYFTPIKLGRHLGSGEKMFQLADMSKLRAALKVDDRTIIRLKTGLKATITSSILPDMVLDAYTASVSREPIKGSSRSHTAQYAVSVITLQLTTIERDNIRMGMSVMVDIQISPPYQALVIPIDAIYMEKDQPKVNRLDDADQPQSVTITTGIASVHDIEIIDGLKAGDRIVIPDI